MSGIPERSYRVWVGGALAIALVGGLTLPVVRSLVRTRGAVTTYARLVAAANVGDLAAIGPLCSTRYLAGHPLARAREGGVVGFPRQIHPNFRAWVEGDEVWLCAGNRVGRVERFVQEGGRWRYDGTVGVLGADGRVTWVGEDRGGTGEKP